MAKKKNEIVILRTEMDFEEVFLPETHEKKKREEAMKELESFEKHLKEELARHI